MLDLNDHKWKTFEGGYKTPFDASVLLKELENSREDARTKEILKEFWQELHHQGDVGLASYLSLPHLIRIGIKNHIIGYDIPCLVAVIETQRHAGNPELPQEYLADYQNEIKEITRLISLNQKSKWTRDFAVCATAAIAAVNGQIELAETILELTDEDLAAKMEFLIRKYDEIEKLM